MSSEDAEFRNNLAHETLYDLHSMISHIEPENATCHDSGDTVQVLVGVDGKTYKTYADGSCLECGEDLSTVGPKVD